MHKCISMGSSQGGGFTSMFQTMAGQKRAIPWDPEFYESKVFFTHLVRLRQGCLETPRQERICVTHL